MNPAWAGIVRTLEQTGRLAYSLLAPLTWTSMTFLPQLPQISTSPGNSYSNFETWFLSDFDSYYTWGQARTVNSTLLWNGSTVTHHCVMDLTPPLASQFQCDLLRASIHPLCHECLTCPSTSPHGTPLQSNVLRPPTVSAAFYSTTLSMNRFSLANESRTGVFVSLSPMDACCRLPTHRLVIEANH